MSTAIPDRWIDYNPIGKKIEGTRFIAFKVPLRERVSATVESEKRLDDRILLERIPKLGLIIDLTNTYRYYDPIVFRKEGVQHVKLMIPGKQTPPIDLTNDFINIVRDFINNNKNNDKLIGVHCTHGVNRTGYLICYYMISQMTMEPKEAMDKFASARGYQIERTNYIMDLNKLKLVDKQNWMRDRGNWRERSENYKNSYDRDARSKHASSRLRDNSHDRKKIYENWRSRSPHRPHNSSRNFKRENSLSSRPIREHVEERSADRYTDHHCTMSNRPRALNLDYYKTRPTFDVQRNNRKRFSAND